MQPPQQMQGMPPHMQQPQQMPPPMQQPPMYTQPPSGSGISYQRYVPGLNGWNDPPKALFAKSHAQEQAMKDVANPAGFVVSHVSMTMERVKAAYEVFSLSLCVYVRLEEERLNGIGNRISQDNKK